MSTTSIQFYHYPGLHVTVCSTSVPGAGFGGHGVRVSGGQLTDTEAMMDSVRLYDCSLDAGYLSPKTSRSVKLDTGDDVAWAWLGYWDRPGLAVKSLSGRLGFYRPAGDWTSIEFIELTPPQGTVHEYTVYQGGIIYLHGVTVTLFNPSTGSETDLGTRTHLTYAILDKLYVCLDDSIKAVDQSLSMTDYVTGGGPYSCGVVKGQFAYLDANSGILHTAVGDYNIGSSFEAGGVYFSSSDTKYITCGGSGCEYIVLILYRSYENRYYVAYFPSSETSPSPALLSVGGTSSFLFASPLYKDTLDSGSVIVGV